MIRGLGEQRLKLNLSLSFKILLIALISNRIPWVWIKCSLMSFQQNGSFTFSTNKAIIFHMLALLIALIFTGAISFVSWLFSFAFLINLFIVDWLIWYNSFKSRTGVPLKSFAYISFFSLSVNLWPFILLSRSISEPYWSTWVSLACSISLWIYA